MSTPLVNDIHARLNPTSVARIERPETIDGIRSVVRRAARQGLGVAVAGGRHAMGGQAFARDAVLLDMRSLNRITAFDAATGVIEAQAGIQWPDLFRGYFALQAGKPVWGLRQKQTGADRLTLGGAVAANIHGRGLGMAPFSQDVLALTVVDADGEVHRVSRCEHPQWFSLIVGGYGLFGVVVSVSLQLCERHKVRRVVETATVEQVVGRLTQQQRAGCRYGDFQFDIDPHGAGFLNRGIVSCYQPVADDTPIPVRQLRLSREDWGRLLVLAHTDKAAAYRQFTDFYLRSSGQVYWSDTHQLNIYLDDYHRAVDKALGRSCPGSEMITELYVPPAQLPAFMQAAAMLLRLRKADVVYGTVRMTEADGDSFLPWARQRFACVILNLHIDHTDAAIDHAAGTFRALIDLATNLSGSYYLTYHRWARPDQLLRCYPQFPDFLAHKRAFDPSERFTSDWYRHHVGMFDQVRHQPRPSVA